MSSANATKGTIQEVTLASRHLNSSERILIYTPPHYSPLYSYPVIYAQDGDDYLSLGRLASLLDQSESDVIAVFLPVEKRQRSDRYHPDGAAHQAYRRFLAEEAVSYVDRNYSTLTLGNGRLLLGESLGGVVSLFTALTYPHTFGQVACQSGAFDDAMLEQVNGLNPFPHLSVYLEAGTEETAVETSRGTLDLYAANLRMRDVLQKKGATLRFETFAGDHTWGYWQENLPRIIRHFFG